MCAVGLVNYLLAIPTPSNGDRLRKLPLEDMERKKHLLDVPTNKSRGELFSETVELPVVRDGSVEGSAVDDHNSTADIVTAAPTMGVPVYNALHHRSWHAYTPCCLVTAPSHVNGHYFGSHTWCYAFTHLKHACSVSWSVNAHNNGVRL